MKRYLWWMVPMSFLLVTVSAAVARKWTDNTGKFSVEAEFVARLARGSRQLGGEPLRRRFQFRSVEIGRWVTEPEKQRSASLFYDALCDLMTILGGTESLISLRGTLALQYGIGGR